MKTIAIIGMIILVAIDLVLIIKFRKALKEK